MISPRPLAYSDFYRTGIQDCGNGLSYDEFDLGRDLKKGTVGQVLDRTWAQWEKDGLEEQWLAQQDDFEGLDPHKCYENWRAGWKACALQALEGYVEERAAETEHENPPPGWWRKPARSKDQPCYRTKTEALARFLETNYEIVENYGGADYEVGPSEFDSINHKYDLKGKRAVRTIADAVWAAMPVGKPYCLDRIDLDALNDTSPAREAGIEFRLPDVAYESKYATQEAQHYGQEPPELPEPSWVTEHEPVQIFPPLPPMPEGPMRLHLEKREPGVETYRMLPPLPPLEEVRPVRMELEEQGPGVETYKIFSNPGAEKVKIKMTSTRSGKVGWIRQDGTPSDHESEAGLFGPTEAEDVIDEYTDQLVRVVGRCANRFEMLPVGGKNNPCEDNPAASWRVWLEGSPNSYVNVEAGNAVQAMMRAAPKFAPGPLFRFLGTQDSAVMVALPQGETTWRTSRRPVEKLVTIEHDGRLAFHPSTPGEDMSQNPSSSARWRVWFSEAPDSYVTVTAGSYMEAMRRAAPQFRGAHDNEVREMIAKIDGGRAIESLVTVGRDGRLTFHPDPPRGNPPRKYEWGFDLTDFKPGGWTKVLCALGMDAEPTRLRLYDDDPDPGMRDKYFTFVWKGKGIEIATSNQPLTGESGSPYGRVEPNFAGYMGLRGTKARVGEAKRLIKKYASMIKDDIGVRGLQYVGFRGTPVYHQGGDEDDVVSLHSPIDNPAWVTKILSKHFVELEEEVPAKWLPKLTKTTAHGTKITAAMKEYGCGAYGCVLPTLDPKVVLKLTTDDTEAQFASELADKLAAPVVVKYHMTRALPDRYKGRDSFLLWRDAADHVGDLGVVVSERGGDGVEAEDAIAEQHKAAQEAYDALFEGKPAEKLLAKWEAAARAMGQKVPELRELADGMITNLKKNKIFMGDVHGGNIGRVGKRWVVVDPGHIAVLEA